MINLFGTDGIRTRVGTEPLTVNTLTQCGHAIARWAHKKYGPNPHLLISHDTRSSAHWIIAALQAGLLLHPITIHTLEVMPTPAVFKLLKLNPQFHAGIVVSASHNAAVDNGLKIIDGNYGKLSLDEEYEISQWYAQAPEYSYNEFGITQPYPQGINEYVTHILAQFPVNFLSHLTIVLDCAHGATSYLAPLIFSQLGARVIPINNEPNGININDKCGTLHMDGIRKEVLKHRADIGFAFDGDGDRVMIATQNGEIKNGDDILALLSNHPHYKNESTIIGTVMSNHGLDVYLQKQQKTLIRTAVGDKHVASYLATHRGMLGGEQSGHIIMRDYLPTGDGMITALRILELLMDTGNWNIETFDKFPQIIINIPITTKKDLNSPPIAQLVTQHEAQLTSGRLVVRYSGTENVLRIMVEDKEEQTAHNISAHLADALAKELR